MKHWTIVEAAYTNKPLDLNEHRLACRLEEILVSLSMPNRTPAAAAVRDALLADMRTAGVSSAALNRLSIDQIAETYAGIMWALKTGDAGAFELPFGTTAFSSVKGTLKIGAQAYVLDAGRPGLHEMETVRRDAHGPNLEMLVASIARKTKRLACRKLGKPVSVHVLEAESRHYLQFAPLPEAGNVVLQRDVCGTGADRFCAALPWQIEEFAKSIVADMRSLWNRRGEIRARAEKVRAAAEAGLRSESVVDGSHSVRAIAIDFSIVGDYPVSLSIEYHTLDEALRLGTVSSLVPASYSLEGRAWTPPNVLTYRTGFRGRLAALGATGLIDEIAEGVARAAPEGISAILARLSTAPETRLVLTTPAGPLYALLFWRDGVIQTELSMPKKLDWVSGRLMLEGTLLPEIVLDALPGRPLSSIVALPFETNAKIIEVGQSTDDGIWLRIEPVEKLVNLSTAQIWEDPGVTSAGLLFG